MKAPSILIRCAAVLIAVAGFAPFALAQQTPGPRPPAFAAGGRFFPMLNRVLTDEQRRSLRAAVETQREKIRALEEQLRASRRALLDATVGGKFDEVAARREAEGAAKAEAELTVIFARALAEIKPPLSARQVEELKNFAPRPALTGAAAEPSAAHAKHLPLPPPLPRDTNGLPVVK